MGKLSNPNRLITDHAERERHLESLRRDVQNWTDPHGYGVEKKIRETVAVLNAAGISTCASCEGHVGKKTETISPWVELGPRMSPLWSWVGQQEIYEAVARELKTTLRDFENKALWQEGNRRVESKGLSTRTQESIAWEKQRDKICKKASALIEQYLQKRDEPAELKPTLHWYYLVIGIDHDPFDIPDWDTLTSKEMKKQESILTKKREAMEKFTDWIREKYLHHGTLNTKTASIEGMLTS